MDREPINKLGKLIGNLVDHHLDDGYAFPRPGAECPVCKGMWHGPPKYIDKLERDCPGAWASPEDLSVWNEMFKPKPTILDTQDTYRGPYIGSSGVTPWTLTTAGFETFAGMSFDIMADWRMALFTEKAYLGPDSTYRLIEADEVINKGYTKGGKSVALGSKIGTTEATISLLGRVTWQAEKKPMNIGYTAIYNADNGLVMFYCGMRFTITHGNTITIDGSRPVLTIQQGV